MDKKRPVVTKETGTYSADFTAGNYRDKRIVRSESFGSFEELTTTHPNGRETYSYSRQNRQHQHYDAFDNPVGKPHVPSSDTTGGSSRGGIRPNANLTYD